MFAAAGVKTLIHSGAFIAALKRCATQNRGFSASCEAAPFHSSRRRFVKLFRKHRIFGPAVRAGHFRTRF